MNNYLKFCILCILCIQFLFLISAEESISQSSYIIKIYNNSIEFISNDFSGNNRVFSFSIVNSTNSENLSVLSVPYTEFNSTFLYVRNVSVSMDLVKEYANCLGNTSRFEINLTQCLTQKEMMEQQKNADITNKQTQIDTMNKDKQDTQNQKFIWAAGAAGLAVFIMFALQGKIGNKVKEKSDEWNKTERS